MSRRKPSKAKRSKRVGVWSRIDPEKRRRAVRGLALLVVILLLLGGLAVGTARLEAHVERQQLSAFPDARVEFVDLPSSLHALAASDLHSAAAPLLDGAWTDPRLCERMANRIDRVGWVEKINFVRRLADATFAVSAGYRMPVAMIQQGTDFLLADRHAVRLPGRYRYDDAWILIQGVAADAPDPGESWVGDDIRAALQVIDWIAREPYARQITAVLVQNHGGRENRLASHIELATDRAGGRIYWGSAPGREFEENTAAVKTALLRANYAATGRCDAGYPVIDISTYPDRFTVPQ